ncbi:hypothetical protein MMC20_002763 [Loxospora ochrophaea]|nr:hypothetical protein [Loxospora ochrophaea]
MSVVALPGAVDSAEQGLEVRTADACRAGGKDSACPKGEFKCDKTDKSCIKCGEKCPKKSDTMMEIRAAQSTDDAADQAEAKCPKGKKKCDKKCIDEKEKCKKQARGLNAREAADAEDSEDQAESKCPKGKKKVRDIFLPIAGLLRHKDFNKERLNSSPQCNKKCIDDKTTCKKEARNEDGLEVRNADGSTDQVELKCPKGKKKCDKKCIDEKAKCKKQARDEENLETRDDTADSTADDKGKPKPKCPKGKKECKGKCIDKKEKCQ